MQKNVSVPSRIFLYVDVYDNISKDNYSSHQTAFLVRVWEWRGIGTDCPVIIKSMHTSYKYSLCKNMYCSRTQKHILYFFCLE